MKALSLKQHWLYAITDLDKRIENRSWRPPNHIIGQTIALHASKKIDINSKAEIYRISDGIVVPYNTPKGCIVATAVIADYIVEGETNDKWFFGPYGWILEDVTKLRKPIPCRGALSLWQVPDDIEVKILKYMLEYLPLLPGTQIVYVPDHADGFANHPDCEEGFVTSMGTKGDAAFCRYWNRDDPDLLRTRANSELTPLNNIVVSDTHPQALVDSWILKLSEEMGLT